MKKLPKSIYDLFELEHFRTRTAMYLGEKKISSLQAFLYGHFYAVWKHDIEEQDHENFSEFSNWVANYYGRGESTAGWKWIILEECENDEVKALDKFFELFDKFKATSIG